MDGITAASDELEDLIQPAVPTWDFGGQMRNQIELAEPDYISDVKADKFFVVRNVQENAVWIRQRRHACASFPVGSLSRAFLPGGKVGP